MFGCFGIVSISEDDDAGNYKQQQRVPKSWIHGESDLSGCFKVERESIKSRWYFNPQTV